MRSREPWTARQAGSRLRAEDGTASRAARTGERSSSSHASRPLVVSHSMAAAVGMPGAGWESTVDTGASYGTEGLSSGWEWDSPSHFNVIACLDWFEKT